MEALKETLAAQPQEEDPKETAAGADNDSSATLHAKTKAELKQATLAAKEAMTLRDKVAADMFQLYANLLSVDAKYAWNKIVQDQTKADPYQDLQGLNRKGPRGMSRKSFEDPCYAAKKLNPSPPLRVTGKKTIVLKMKCFSTILVTLLNSTIYLS